MENAKGASPRRAGPDGGVEELGEAHDAAQGLPARLDRRAVLN
jgi:hypothetical protein